MINTSFILYIFIAIISYLIASFSPGIIIARSTKNIDLRDYGSKSTGATNALRVMGLPIGLMVFIIDVIKSLLACFIAGHIISYYNADLKIYASMLASIFAVLGHNWPIYYNFKGGKGVAVSIAACIYIFPLYGLIAGVICIITIALSRYVSLGSMIYMLSFTIIIMFNYVCQNTLYCLWSIILLILLVFQHRANIKRLIAGTENKLGKRTK